MVASRDAAAGPTRATGTPLTQPTGLAALRSPGGLWAKKSGDFPGSGLDVGWETLWSY